MSKGKRVLLYSANPYPGGAARVFADLVNALENIDTKHRYKIIAAINRSNTVQMYDDIKTEKIFFDVKGYDNIYKDSKSIKNIYLKAVMKLLRLIGYLPVYISNIKNFKQGLIKNNIDYVISSNGGYPGDTLCLQLLKAAMKARIKTRILILHNYAAKRNILERLYYHIYDSNISRICTDIVTVSKFSKEQLETHTKLGQNIQVIYNGLKAVNELALTEKLNQLNINEFGEPIIGMIGNFERRKGHIYLLKTVNELCNMRKHRLQVIIIGNRFEEDYYTECVKFIKDNNLEKVVSIKENIFSAGQYTECFDIVVFPSIAYESFGLVSLEAMMAGVPVVTFRQGGIPEVVDDEKTGFIVDAEDYISMADKIEMLCVDESLRDKLGKEAKTRYQEKFTDGIMATGYLKLLKYKGVKEYEC